MWLTFDLSHSLSITLEDSNYCINISMCEQFLSLSIVAKKLDPVDHHKDHLCCKLILWHTWLGPWQEQLVHLLSPDIADCYNGWWQATCIPRFFGPSLSNSDEIVSLQRDGETLRLNSCRFCEPSVLDFDVNVIRESSFLPGHDGVWCLSSRQSHFHACTIKIIKHLLQFYQYSYPDIMDRFNQ